jgi:hypothetical protein
MCININVYEAAGRAELCIYVQVFIPLCLRTHTCMFININTYSALYQRTHTFIIEYLYSGGYHWNDTYT